MLGSHSEVAQISFHSQNHYEMGQLQITDTSVFYLPPKCYMIL